MPDTVANRPFEEDTGRGAVSGGHVTDWRDRDQYRLRDASHAGAARPSRGADGGTRQQGTTASHNSQSPESLG